MERSARSTQHPCGCAGRQGKFQGACAHAGVARGASRPRPIGGVEPAVSAKARTPAAVRANGSGGGAHHARRRAMTMRVRRACVPKRRWTRKGAALTADLTRSALPGREPPGRWLQQRDRCSAARVDVKLAKAAFASSTPRRVLDHSAGTPAGRIDMRINGASGTVSPLGQLQAKCFAKGRNLQCGRSLPLRAMTTDPRGRA
jgi:hypothetical protein